MTGRSPVGVLGYGRCGRLAAATLGREFEVLVHDRRDLGAAVEAAGHRWVDLAELAGLPRVVLAVPNRALPAALDALAPGLTPGALVVDLGSVKERPLVWMAERLPDGVRRVGAHPLFGPDSVAEEGLRGQRIVVCAADSHEPAADEVCEVAARLGLEPVRVDAGTHDRAMARSQAVVFLVARALRRAGIEPGQLETPSERGVYAALALVEGDTDELYEDILRLNRHAGPVARALAAAIADEVERVLGGGPAGAGPGSA